MIHETEMLDKSTEAFSNKSPVVRNTMYNTKSSFIFPLAPHKRADAFYTINPIRAREE